MKDKKKLILSLITVCLATLNLLCFYSVRAMWSGIIAIAGDASVYIIFAVCFIMAAAVITAFIFKYRGVPFYSVILGLSVIITALITYIFITAQDSRIYFIREFGYSALFAVCIAAGLYLCLCFKGFTKNVHKALAAAFIIIAVLALFCFVKGIRLNSLNSCPVVYAVDDTYQIVFTSAAKGSGWVEVNGKLYNDTFAGSRITNSTVHKVSVPMEELDDAGSYTIYTRSMLIKGPYSAMQGRTLSQTYSWRGVDPSDGLHYYVVSDTHTDYKYSSSAASYWGASLDFLICAGDTANWLDREADIDYFLTLAGNVTKGEIPVIYARGNHETKGEIADTLYRYVAADNQNFYYTFRLKNIWGIVLDSGEDHADDWWEFFDSAEYDSYRNEQTAFLDAVIADKENEYAAAGIDTRIAVCHVPITLRQENDYISDINDSWIERLNQMQLDIMFSGHRHQLMFVDAVYTEATKPDSLTSLLEWQQPDVPLTYTTEYLGKEAATPDRYTTNAAFPSVLVSRKSSTARIDTKECSDKFIGLAVSFENGVTTLRFTNQDGEPLESVPSAWHEGIDYGSGITLK